MITTLFIVLIGSILYALIFTPAIGSRFGNLGIRKSKTLQNADILEHGDPTEIDGMTGTYARALKSSGISSCHAIYFSRISMLENVSIL